MAAAVGAARGRRAGKRRSRWYVWVLLLLALCAVGAMIAMRFFLFLDGHLIRKDADPLDLRQYEITPEEYESVRGTMPAGHVLWSVPFGGGRFDAGAESIAVTSFDESELDLLRYFTNLKSLDASAAELTAEQFEKLRAALPGCAIRWSIPLGGERYPSDAREIVLHSLSAEELDLFDYFDALESADCRECADLEAVMALRERCPDLALRWTVPLGTGSWEQDAREITADGSVTAAQLAAALRYLPQAESVRVPECAWTKEERLSLLEQYPDICFYWPVTVLGQTFNGAEAEISFAGRALTEADVEEIVLWSPYLPQLRKLDLTGCGLSAGQLLRLHEALPEAELLWELELYGVTITPADTFLDFTGIAMDSVDAVEELFPLMPLLEKVDMTDTGLSDEELDGLNKRHENVRTVWTIRIVYYKIRTDAVGFRASSNHWSDFTDENILRLRYCEDMVALDIGHRYIPTLEFLYGMPKLKYLVLMSCVASDLTPVASCSELVWLELNHASSPDISPLKSCTKLTDLNVADTKLDSQVACDTINAMPQLERLWYSNRQFTDEQIRSMAETNPDLLMHRVPGGGNACETPWRFDQDYYDMRDVLNMFYMDENMRVNYKIIDGVRIDLDPEFIANQGDTSHDRDRW